MLSLLVFSVLNLASSSLVFSNRQTSLENFWSYTETLQELMGCATTFWSVLNRMGLEKLLLWVQAPPNVWESLLLDEDFDVSTWAWSKLHSSRKHLLRLKRAGPASHGGTRLVFASALVPMLCFAIFIVNIAIFGGGCFHLLGFQLHP